MLVYLDANAVIFLCEGPQDMRVRVLSALQDVGFGPNSRLLTSKLTRLEACTKPLRLGNHRLVAAFDRFFNKPRFQLADIGDEVLLTATALRAKYNFRTPDAIHLATAITWNAVALITGDKQLLRCGEIEVRLL